MSVRNYLLAAAAILPTFAACGGDDGMVIPEGPHYHYIANHVFVPVTNTQAREYGLDLNGDKTVDNQLGMVLSQLAGMGFKIQDTIDTAVAEGSIVLLLDFQTKDFTNTTAAGVQVFLGDNKMVTPAACNGSADMYDPVSMMGCGHHLDGNGSFVVDSASPTNAALGGKIAGGTFTAGPGDITLQIALGGTDAISLNLIGARAKGTGVTDTAIGSSTSGGIVFGGAVTKDDIDNKVIPQIALQLAPIITRDCPPPYTGASAPPGCGCGSSSTGKTILSLFDADPKDCAVSKEEIATNSLIVSLLAPDVTIDGKKALSLGIKATGVKATYTVAGQM